MSMIWNKALKETSLQVVKSPSGVAVTDVAPTFLPPTSQVTSGPAQVKSSRTSTRKRPSDSAFTTEILDVSAPENSQVSKKLKADVATKIPLSPVTNKNIPTSNEAMFGYPQDPSFMLDNVRGAIAGQQHIIQTLRALPFKSRQDLRNISSAEDELQRLDALEQVYQTASLRIPSPSFSSSFFETGALPHAFQPTLSFNGDFTPRASSSSEQYPMDIDAPFIRSSSPDFIPASSSLSPSFVDSFRPTPTRYASTVHNTGNSIVLDQKPNVNAAQASSSNQLPATPQAVTTTTSLPNKLAQTYNPQASSCKELPDVHQGTDSDSDDSDADSDEGNVDATEFLNRIGVEAPLPIQNDAVDDNGDYYGRGRDMFDGPRASHEELVFLSRDLPPGF